MKNFNHREHREHREGSFCSVSSVSSSEAGGEKIRMNFLNTLYAHKGTPAIKAGLLKCAAGRAGEQHPHADARPARKEGA